jgi:hypothetical protein
MKFTGPCEVKFIEERAGNDVYEVIPAKEDKAALKIFMAYKTRRDARDKTNIYPEVSFYIEAKERTYSQNSTVFKLLTIILITELGRKPTHAEIDEAYKDLLEMYADRRPCRFDKNKLVPIHLSKSDVYQASRLVQGAIDYLVTMCNLHPSNDYFITTNLQADVRQYIKEWQVWRGELERDPVDYIDYEKGLLITEREWKKRHPVCEACLVAALPGDPLEKCHIVSRGAASIEEPWNWLQLHYSHHRLLQHQEGWKSFLNIYTHLVGRVNRAREMAGKRGKI